MKQRPWLLQRTSIKSRRMARKAPSFSRSLRNLVGKSKAHLEKAVSQPAITADNFPIQEAAEEEEPDIYTLSGALIDRLLDLHQKNPKSCDIKTLCASRTFRDEPDTIDLVDKAIGGEEEFMQTLQRANVRTIAGGLHCLWARDSDRPMIMDETEDKEHELLGKVVTLLQAVAGHDFDEFRALCEVFGPSLFRRRNGGDPLLKVFTTGLDSNEELALVLYDFETRNDRDLRLGRGEIVEIVKKYPDGWWVGKNASGSSGEFPSNFVCTLSRAQISRREKVILNALVETLRNMNEDPIKVLSRMRLDEIDSLMIT